VPNLFLQQGQPGTVTPLPLRGIAITVPGIAITIPTIMIN
jgi:hypothetical protein